MRRAAFILALVVPALVLGARFDCSFAKPAKSEQDRLVFDYVGDDFLSASERDRLNAKLATFARETSNQLLVLIVDTLCGYPESDLAFEVGEKWGIGQQGFDNGIVFLVKPTGPPGQRKVFIATGYGLEGAIPDLTTKRIIDREVIPRFKQGQYFEGLDKATDVLMALAKGEFDHQSYGKGPPIWPVLVFILFVFAIIVLGIRSRVKRYARTNDLDFWTAWMLLSQMDRKHSGSWGGFTGRGGGGFSGGGGFGGFGGGSFGGGGAGGSW